MANRAREVWYWETINQEPKYGRVKGFLLERLYLSLTQHNLLECYKLLRILPRDTSVDPDLLFRYLLILLNSVDTDDVHKNFITYLELSISRLNISKQCAFFEFVAYLIRNNRIDDARELFNQRLKDTLRLKHRYIPYIESNIKCYKFYLDHNEWKRKKAHRDVRFDYSIQGWLVNTMDAVRDASCNYEYFAASIIEVLLFYKFYKKAYLFSSEFQRLNPGNLPAQLMHLRLTNLLTQLSNDDKKLSVILTEDDRHKNRINDISNLNNFPLNEDEATFFIAQYPIETDRKEVYNNIRRLDIRRPEVLESTIELDHIETIMNLMDSLEYLEEIRNPSRWQSLQDHINHVLTSNDERVISQLRDLWQTRYQMHWRLDYFLKEAGEDFAAKDSIRNTVAILSSRFDQPDDFLASDSIR